MCVFVWLLAYLFICLRASLFDLACLSVCLSACVFVCLFVWLVVCVLFVCMRVRFSVRSCVNVFACFGCNNSIVWSFVCLTVCFFGSLFVCFRM